MKTICLLTQNHLSRNPRVYKEACWFAENGHQVTILTTWHNNDFLKDDFALLQDSAIRYVPYADLRMGFPGSRAHRIRFQLFRRTLKTLGIETIDSAGYGPQALLRSALRTEADVYIAHQEIPTLIAPMLVKKGKKVAYDFEDWYSRDLTPAQRLYRPLKLLERAESFALSHGVWCTTTSHSLAEGLSCLSPGYPTPRVIYNAFSLKERQALSSGQAPESTYPVIRLAWISQTIGPGRGLEEFLLHIRERAQPLEIHLAGKERPDFSQILHSLVREYPQIRIVLHDPMAPDHILPWLNQFDAGIASDLATSDSRNLTVTNKILHYLLAGIPVIATPTAGHKEIATACPEAVCLTTETESLDRFLNGISSGKPERYWIREKAWEAGTRYSWEKQTDTLQKLFHQVFPDEA